MTTRRLYLSVSTFLVATVVLALAPPAALAAQVPAAPNALELVEVGNSAVQVSWTDRSNNEVEFVVDVVVFGFVQESRVIRDHRGGQPQSTGSRVWTVVPGLTQYRTYCFGVAARNTAGSSGYESHDMRCVVDPEPAPPVTVPNVRFDPRSAADTRIRQAGLVPAFSGPGGIDTWVYSQSPVAGTTVLGGSTVRLTLRAGPIP